MNNDPTAEVSTAKVSTAEPLQATPPGRGGPAREKAASSGRRAAQNATASDAGSSFAIQGAIGFLAGGLITVICSGASALAAFENIEVVVRFLGYGLGGALGGAALAWGSSRKHAPRVAAFGFALAFLFPAAFAGSALGRLLTVKPEAYGFGTFVGTVMVFTIGFGIAGAIGGSFVLPRLFWAGLVRFGLAGAVGALVAATVPAFHLHADNVTPQHLIGVVAALIGGHLIPFVLGGFWFGRALEAEERAQGRKRGARRS